MRTLQLDEETAAAYDTVQVTCFSKPPWPYLEDHCDSLGSCSHEDKGQRALGDITVHWAEGTRACCMSQKGTMEMLLKGFT